MTEDEARAWLDDNFDVSRGTWQRLEALINLVIDENGRQNLIAASTISTIWNRHIVDSAQLILQAQSGDWIDFGSGAGFPGLVVAILENRRVTLVESRRKRIDFLNHVVVSLGLPESSVSVIGKRAEAIDRPESYAVISARAFAPLDRIFDLTTRFSTEDTQWVLPKGRSAQEELAHVQRTWQGSFRIEPSVTDAEAGIIVATHVRPKSSTAGKTR